VSCLTECNLCIAFNANEGPSESTLFNCPAGLGVEVVYTFADEELHEPLQVSERQARRVAAMDVRRGPPPDRDRLPGNPQATLEQRRRACWESVSVSAIVLLVVAAGITGLWLTSREFIYQNFRDYLVGLAKEAAIQVDTAAQVSIRRPEELNNPQYIQAVEPLRRFRDADANVHYVYTLVVENNLIHFVLDAAEPNVRPGGQSDQSGVWEVYHPDPTENLLRLLVAGEPAASDHPVTDKWGTFMSGFAPLHDARGSYVGMVGVDVDSTVYLLRQRRALERALLGLGPAGSLIGLFGYVFYRIRLRGLAELCARKAMEAKLIEAAERDRLTGLPNRVVFMEHVEQALARVRGREQANFAVLFLDFDHLKLLNDTLGHAAGDELLRQIGKRLRLHLESGSRADPGCVANSVARFGGDEFLILLNDTHDATDIEGFTGRLLAALAPSYDVYGSEVHSTASIGIVTNSHCLQATAEEVVRNADVAMYEAKRAGRGCSVVFNDVMQTRVARHVAIETGLRHAVQRGELYLEFQPIVHLESGKRYSVEALVRWQHPAMGLISPSEFIPIAEESGLILVVGEWVMMEACRIMTLWRADEAEAAPRVMSVNVSRAELALGNRLLERVRNVLALTSLPPECLQLEVTEREVMRHPEASRRLLFQLHDLGVQLAMDDFGTGTSSLSLLRGYPFDAVKIDRSFLNELHNSREVLAVIQATIDLIENLGMVSIAEGVEDIRQIATLQALGCVYGQGFYFSRPMRADHGAATAVAS
jgi:diguanylate cyclase (GGDEF)-like protein